MPSDAVLNAVMQEHAGFHLEDAEAEPADPYAGHCQYARDFAAWGHRLLERFLDAGPEAAGLIQAKAHLLDRYMQLWSVLPKGHRTRTGDRGHVCVHQVLVGLYVHLRAIELERIPAPLLPPPPPPAARAPQLLGITIGEVLGEE